MKCTQFRSTASAGERSQKPKRYPSLHRKSTTQSVLRLKSLDPVKIKLRATNLPESITARSKRIGGFQEERILTILIVAESCHMLMDAESAKGHSTSPGATIETAGNPRRQPPWREALQSKGKTAWFGLREPFQCGFDPDQAFAVAP